MSQLGSQKIVILGGTSGIGLATAQLAAAEGATVVVASSNPERVDAALANLPVNAEGYALDLRREEEIRDLFERRPGKIHFGDGAGSRAQGGLSIEIHFPLIPFAMRR